MGVVEPKTKKPQLVPGLRIGAEGRRFPACWSGSLGQVPQTLIALSIREHTALIGATTDLAQLPGRVIRMNKDPSICRGHHIFQLTI